MEPVALGKRHRIQPDAPCAVLPVTGVDVRGQPIQLLSSSRNDPQPQAINHRFARGCIHSQHNGRDNLIPF